MESSNVRSDPVPSSCISLTGNETLPELSESELEGKVGRNWVRFCNSFSSNVVFLDPVRTKCCGH